MPSADTQALVASGANDPDRTRDSRRFDEQNLFRWDHSGLIAANFTTLPHFSVSSAMSLPKSACKPGSTMPPKSANRAFIFGSARGCVDLLVELVDDLRGVLVGAPNPNHWLVSRPGTNSPAVGMSGSTSKRDEVVTASG
jgi:hypothetical protein